MSRTFTSHKPKATRPLPKPVARRKAEATPSKPSATRGTERPKEIGGPSGPEPTRYGDWERKGVCVDF